MVVYPRWRGELDRTASVVSSGSGLSPLARGTRAYGIQSRVSARFIPAGAGNTGSATAAPMTTSVYPRWRGEHITPFCDCPVFAGLSPLARGTRGCSVFHYAGWPVYPRWRGEHSKHNLLLINDFLSQSQSTNFIVSHKQHIHYVKEHLIH